MYLFIRSLLLMTFIALASTGVNAEDTNNHHSMPRANEAVAQQLSPKLRLVLQQEMQAISADMVKLVPAIVSADWNGIKTIGNAIQDSYIMKKTLSEHELHELHQQLPKGFQKIDAEFHQMAGLLAHAAEKKNSTLTNFAFYKMVENCTQCHSTYALNRFPEFNSAEKSAHH